MRRDGPLMTGARHLLLRARFAMGTSPDELAKADGGL
jgi:hypothetical protein